MRFRGAFIPSAFLAAYSLLAPAADAQTEKRQGRYCQTELGEGENRFRAGVNTYRTPEKILLFVIRKRLPAESHADEFESFRTGSDYATFTMFDESKPESPKNSLFIGGKYKSGPELTPDELKLLEDAMVACPDKPSQS